MNQVIEITPIKKILQHREPFLFLDEVLDINLKDKIIKGRLNVQKKHCDGHQFFGQDIFPGYLAAEAIGQLAGVLFYKLKEQELDEGQEIPIGVLSETSKLKWSGFIVSGRTLVLEARIVGEEKKSFIFEGHGCINNQEVVKVEACQVLIMSKKLFLRAINRA